jgi:hypothetical protein
VALAIPKNVDAQLPIKGAQPSGRGEERGGQEQRQEDRGQAKFKGTTFQIKNGCHFLEQTHFICYFYHVYFVVKLEFDRYAIIGRSNQSIVLQAFFGFKPIKVY